MIIAQSIIISILIILLLVLLLVIHSMIKRITILEKVVIDIYNSLVVYYEFTKVNSNHITGLWSRVTEEEIKQGKHTIN